MIATLLKSAIRGRCLCLLLYGENGNPHACKPYSPACMDIFLSSSLHSLLLPIGWVPLESSGPLLPGAVCDWLPSSSLALNLFKALLLTQSQSSCPLSSPQNQETSQLYVIISSPPVPWWRFFCHQSSKAVLPKVHWPCCLIQQAFSRFRLTWLLEESDYPTQTLRLESFFTWLPGRIMLSGFLWDYGYSSAYCSLCLPLKCGVLEAQYQTLFSSHCLLPQQQL